jgi:anti-sigma factor RsiW
VTRSHTDLEELIGAYVCDAVEPDERLAIERHLPTCPRCRAEVAELREVTALLANADAATTVPDGTWDRILASLEEAPPPLRLSVVPADKDQMQAHPLSADQPGRRRRFAAIAAAAAVVVGVLGFSLGRTTDSSTPPPAGLEAAAFHALVEPGSRTAALLNDTQVKTAVAVVRSNGEGYLIGDNLPPLTDRIYQLWGSTPDGSVVSLGAINSPGVFAFTVGDPAAINALMLTEEIHPVDHSSNPPVAQGSFA